LVTNYANAESENIEIQDLEEVKVYDLKEHYDNRKVKVKYL
jgi:hypothetical protein